MIFSQPFTSTHIAKAPHACPPFKALSKSVSVPAHRKINSAAKITDRLLNDKNGQLVTACIVHLVDSADFKVSTLNKLCSGLTGLCFESPNDTIHANRCV